MYPRKPRGEKIAPTLSENRNYSANLTKAVPRFRWQRREQVKYWCFSIAMEHGLPLQESASTWGVMPDKRQMRKEKWWKIPLGPARLFLAIFHCDCVWWIPCSWLRTRRNKRGCHMKPTLSTSAPVLISSHAKSDQMGIAQNADAQFTKQLTLSLQGRRCKPEIEWPEFYDTSSAFPFPPSSVFSNLLTTLQNLCSAKREQ